MPDSFSIMGAKRSPATSGQASTYEDKHRVIHASATRRDRPSSASRHEIGPIDGERSETEDTRRGGWRGRDRAAWHLTAGSAPTISAGWYHPARRCSTDPRCSVRENRTWPRFLDMFFVSVQVRAGRTAPACSLSWKPKGSDPDAAAPRQAASRRRAFIAVAITASSAGSIFGLPGPTG